MCIVGPPSCAANLVKAMRLFKCWKQSTETKNEKQTRSITYTQEGNASSPGDVEMDEGNVEKPKKADTSTSVKKKTTSQMAKSVPLLPYNNLEWLGMLIKLGSCVNVNY